MNVSVRHLPWIGGAADVAPGAAFSPLVSPIDETVASHIVESDAAIIDAAVKHAHAAYLAHQDETIAKRVEWLMAAADAIDKIEAELIRSLIRVIGKPRRAATFEAKRAGAFIRACAAQLPHLNGEVLPLDVNAAGAGRFGFTTRVPYGVVAAITPFNGPVNLLVQKLAPALAMGNAVVVKPSPPGTEVALLLAEAVKQAGLPDGLFNVVPGGRDTRRCCWSPIRWSRRVTVTGSTAAGHELARAAGAKRFVAELGSNAANIVCADADLADAAQRMAGAAFEASGQQCISAQRVIVEQPVYERFLELFVAAAKKLKVGDPEDPATDVGPDDQRAPPPTGWSRWWPTRSPRARGWCSSRSAAAASSGPPSWRRRRAGARLMSEEAFGPVVVVQPVADVDAALALANSSEFGLQGACFTSEPRDRLQGVAQAAGRLALDQRSEPLPARHLSVRRRRLERLRPRGRPLRHGGNVAVEVHRHPPQPREGQADPADGDRLSLFRRESHLRALWRRLCIAQ